MRWALGNLDELDGGKVYNTRFSKLAKSTRTDI